MQLANMEMDGQLLNERCKEALRAHGILESDYAWFLKPATDFNTYIAQCFELSLPWLKGLSNVVTDTIRRPHSIEEFYQYVLHGKQAGLKPRVIFVRSDIDEARPLVSIFIELFKTTPTNLAYTAYKQWDIEVFEEVLTLCQYAGLPYMGLRVVNSEYNRLKRHQVIPAKMLRKPIGLWFPEKYETGIKSYFSDKIINFSEQIRYAAVSPTYLHNMS